MKIKVTIPKTVNAKLKSELVRNLAELEVNEDGHLIATMTDGATYDLGKVSGDDGKDGQDGVDGKDGVSVTHEWIGTVLRVTSASGTSEADLKGEKGDAFAYEDFTEDQLAALKGDKGYSPTITVEAITGGHRITITDANGSESIDVMDGVDGEGAGDMLSRVYDPQGKAQDVFDYTDTVQKNLETHDENTTKHITEEERTAWNNKADGTHTHTKSQITDFPSTMPPSAHAESHKTRGSDPIAPGDIGAVSKTGDTMTGNLTVNKSSYPSLFLDSGDAGSRLIAQNIGHSAYFSMNNVAGDNNNYRAIRVADSSNKADVKEGLLFVDVVAGALKNYLIYGEHNKPTPEAIGAVSRTGDTVTGKLTVSSSGFSNQFEINREGTTGVSGVTFTNDNGRLGVIGMGVDKHPVVASGDSTTAKYLYYGGTKPNGTYTGNGSDASRTINVGTKGRIMAIYSNNGCALVTGFGAIVATGTGSGSVTHVDGSAALVNTSGDLVLATTDKTLNANGVTYYYYSL